MTAASLDTSTGDLAAAQAPCVNAKAPGWAGRWFEIVEREAGEFIGMRAGRRTPSSEEPVWIFHSHAVSDGVGWLATLLRKEGADVAIPQLRETERPSWLELTRAFLRLVGRKPYPAAVWKTFDAGWRAPAGGGKASKAIVVHAFDAEQTRRLADRAAAEGASLNSLLLSTLGKASRPELEGEHVFWMVPVNMRGPVTLPSDTQSHTSYLQVDTGAGISARAVHEQVKAKLGRLEHWGGWVFINSGRVVRFAGMKWLYRREVERSNGHPWVGAFSNLGSWETEDPWFMCPPVTRTCPLAACVATYSGCLTVTVDAHASIATDAAWTRALLDRWLAELGV